MNDTAFPRATGLLIIEVRNSNPNGDPDQEGDPRQRSHDQRGEISPVSFKRKLRDLVGNKDGEVWKELSRGLNLAGEDFDILESRRHDRQEIEDLLKKDFERFKRRFWDGRIFGNTFLEQELGDTIRTGVAQFGLGVSVAPVRIERQTTTKMAPAQKGRDGKEPTRGMAPLGYRIVEHGVYCMPFTVNPTAASRSGCTKRDIDLLLALIPYAYPHTASYVRPLVEVRHAWYVEHKSALGSCSDFAIFDALTPRKEDNPEEPSTRWADYGVPTDLGELKQRVEPLRDLMQPT